MHVNISLRVNVLPNKTVIYITKVALFLSLVQRIGGFNKHCRTVETGQHKVTKENDVNCLHVK